MPLGVVTTVKDQGRRTVLYRDAKGRSFNATVDKMSGARGSAPTQPTPSTNTSGGTLAAATYSYRFAVVKDGVESAAAAAVTQITTGSTSTVTLTWTNDPTVQAYRVYGRVGGSELLMAELPAGSTNWTDTGAVTPAGAIPAALGSNAIHIRIPGFKPYQMTLGGVEPATAEGQLGRYYVR